MSNLDKTAVHRIAKLAKLQISNDEAEKQSVQLSRALHFFEQISTISTDGIEPLVTPIEIEVNLREDIVIETCSVDELTANAPHKTGNLFTVPPVV